MQTLAEFDPKTTSAYELLVHLYDRILTGKITTFEALVKYTAGLPEANRSRGLLKRCFDLMRLVFWGFFRNLTAEHYPDLWKLLVVADPKYEFAGDLKRTVSSPDLFIGLIDVHGYTKFCQKNRHNMTMLDYLDRVIFDDIAQIATKQGVISKRERGDEILLIGGSVGAIVETVLLIMTYLSKDLKAKAASGFEKTADHAFLPEFQISAGVTGGQKYAALAMTRSGTLSGDLLNTAARLQARANKVSPEHNKILMSTHAFHRLKAKLDPGQFTLSFKVGFLNTGAMEFKGASLSVHEVIFLEREGHRQTYQSQMEQLFLSIQKKQWRGKIFEDALALLSGLVVGLPDLGKLDRGEVKQRIRAALDLYTEDRFDQAIAFLDGLIDDFAPCESQDPLAYEYLTQIREGYHQVLATYFKALDQEAPGSDTGKVTEMIRKYQALLEATRKEARAKLRNPRIHWVQAAEQTGASFEVRIRSMK